jgi:hypothetical protein
LASSSVGRGEPVLASEISCLHVVWVQALPRGVSGRVTWLGAPPFTSLPYAQDTGGKNPCIDTKDILELLIVGNSAVRC